MFDLSKILTTGQKDRLARLISMDPEAFKRFEESYKGAAIDGAFGQSVKDVVASNRVFSEDELEAFVNSGEGIIPICERIVDELLCDYRRLPAPRTLVTREDLSVLPLNIRPQLTGTLMKVDMSEPAYLTVLSSLDQCLHAKDPKEAMQQYGIFRQGLEILDLDPICYELLGRNPNNMSHWLPALQTAATKQSFFKIPETKIVKVPLTMLQLSRLDFSELTITTKYIVNQFCMRAFDLDVTKSYFIKTGVFSSKFDFRNAKVTGEQEVRELGEYLLYITHLACQMASPLHQPCIYGAGTTNEWVVREFIEDPDNNPCIYHGLPLRTEFRVFIDCDTDEILGISPYWRPDVMKKRFGNEEDRNTHDMIHDYVVYTAHEPVLMKRYEENKDRVLEAVKDLLPDLELKGQWSLDVMQNGSDFYLIDMATADTSALNDVVPAEKLKREKMPVQCFFKNEG